MQIKLCIISMLVCAGACVCGGGGVGGCVCACVHACMYLESLYGQGTALLQYFNYFYYY